MTPMVAHRNTNSKTPTRRSQRFDAEGGRGKTESGADCGSGAWGGGWSSGRPVELRLRGNLGSEIIAYVVVWVRDPRTSPEQFSPHCCILRLQGLYALGYVAIIDVAAIDSGEMAQGSWFIVRNFAGGPKFVVNGEARFLVEAGDG